MKTLEKTQKEYKKLNHLLIIIIGMILSFHHAQKIGKKIEQNNKAIALNILYVPYNTKQIKQPYISKYNSERDNQVNLFMITDSETNWHHLVVKNISGLLRGITSNHDDDFYCLNCFHSYTSKRKLKKHEKICKGHDFCYPKIPNEDNKISEHIPGEQSLKVPFIIYANLECLLKKINTCQNNPDKSLQKKKQSIYLQVIL